MHRKMCKNADAEIIIGTCLYIGIETVWYAWHWRKKNVFIL